MAAAAFVLAIGLLLLTAAGAVAIDFKRIGTKWARFQLYVNAAPWRRNPIPQPARIEDRRLLLALVLGIGGPAFLITGATHLG